MSLPKHYKPEESEPKWQAFWRERGIYSYDRESDKPVFSIDTPPPTVSGKIHLGHVFSYVQAEAVARYWRMKGHNVVYPFGFDDNGLPTERFAERKKGLKAWDVDREEFNQICLELTRETEGRFKTLWTSLGFSADWGLEYSTIDQRCQRISQRSFLDLYRKGRIYRKEAPNLWCPECQTAVAQAETEDREIESEFHDIHFHLVDGCALLVATTRPELLASCVAVFVHPHDPRFHRLAGAHAIVPVFDVQVPIIADQRVDMEKGSGVVMCCTFGDVTDVEWWQEHSLPLKTTLTREGRFSSQAGELEGLGILEARKRILTLLRDRGCLVGSKPWTHPVNVHERCGTELELLVTGQWFIRILDLKQELLQQGEKMQWYPSYMKVRFDHWVQNLRWDWCVSRQRVFGVPFPLWFCRACGQVRLAKEEDLPVDPMKTDPSSPCVCGANRWLPEKDVMDTWATSSLTPQIVAGWGEKDEDPKLFPMSLRPQAHDIIRTWAFYTIVKAYLHQGTVPWKNLMISGHALNPSREKMSKSKGNVAGDPESAIRAYSADVLRYWACGGKLGTDVFFSDAVFGQGKRMVTKLWNASRLILMHLGDDQGERPERLQGFDRWLLSRLADTVHRCTQAFDEYEYSDALKEIERFLWADLCDNYLELAKNRLYNEEKVTGRESAKWTLWETLYRLLQILAPIMPHVVEEIYQARFRTPTSPCSIHITPWPSLPKDWRDPQVEEQASTALAILTEARRFKSDHGLSMGSEIGAMAVKLSPEKAKGLEPFLCDLLGATRATQLDLLPTEDVKEIEIQVLDSVDQKG